ncbi:MAG: calcium/sodium antiporter [Rhodospirillaceae bacterium]|nr:calcium/sodium antiporter [Rhodospirillaceae bacterium]
MALALGVVGFLLMLVGGDLVVRGAVAIAHRLNVSALLIGLTLVGFGTSLPELMTSLQAALAGAPGISIGNVVGSNICNILLVLGIAALLRPVVATPAAFRRDGAVVMAVTVIGIALMLLGVVDRLAGAAMLVGLAAYVYLTYRSERGNHSPAATVLEEEAELAPTPPGRLSVALALLVAGLVALVFGSGLLVDAAVALARLLEVSETLIGLTVVAVGTSLPELVTSVVAAIRRQSDVALGNILGSNVFNILGILGATGVVSPVPVPQDILNVDVWVMLAATVALVVVVRTGWRVSRIEGAGLLGAYVAYLVFGVVAT